MDVRREQIPLLWSTVGDTALPLAKGFVFLGVGYEVFECVCRRTKGCACRFLQLLPGSVYSEDLALFRVNVYVPSALPLHAERICILRGLGTFQGECLCSICPPMQRGSAYSEDLALFRVNVYVPSALPCREDLHSQRTWHFSG